MTERWPRSVGGDPALDFVNTDVFSQGDRSSDVLRSREEFHAWCEHLGIASAIPDEPVLRDAIGVRAAIRSLVEAIADRRAADPEALIALRSAYSDAIGRSAAVLGGDGLEWARESASPRSALDELVAAAVDLLRYGRVDRLKACPGCGFLFLDGTKNGTRRWCSMEDCGTQAKMQRYVAKRAASRVGS